MSQLRRRVLDLLRWEADIAFRRRAATIVEYLAPGPNDLILDAGCGLGFTLHLLAMLGCRRLVGLEAAEERLRPARRDTVFTGARLVAGDVQRLPWRDAVFDGVILSEVLEHLPQPQRALAETARVLRPGGVLAVSVPHRDYPFLWDPLNATRERMGLGHFANEPWSGIWTDHVRLYTPEELIGQVEQAGLHVTDWQLQTRYAAPFAHHAVYVMGKAVLGRRSRTDPARGDRWSYWGAARPGPFMRFALRAFTLPDRWNADRYDRGPAVGLCLRAVRPC